MLVSRYSEAVPTSLATPVFVVPLGVTSYGVGAIVETFVTGNGAAFYYTGLSIEA
jgi:hypothetical protein